MLALCPISSVPVGSFPAAAVIAANEYAITATTTIPVASMQINVEIDITATTSAPLAAITATLQQSIDIAASTNLPSVACSIIQQGIYSIAASTKLPTVSAELSSGGSIDIAATTASPKVSATLTGASLYIISAATGKPVLLMTVSTPIPVIAPGETTAWCVNMVSGAHSRYTDYPDAAVDSVINAYALTPVADFGDSHEKYCADIYINCRLPDNGITIDTITDEWIIRTGYAVEPGDSVQGITRRRRSLAKRIKGQHWQYRVNNINGGGFTIKQLEPIVIKSQRRI